MANLTTTNDLLIAGLFQSGVTNSTTTADTSNPLYLQGLIYLNRVHLDLKRGNGPLSPDSNITFKWAIKSPTSVLILQPKYDTDTVAVTNGSNTATLSTPGSTDFTDYHLILDEEDDVHRVSSHSGGNATLTLDAAYTGDTDAAASYKLVKVQYNIGSSDIMRLVEPFRVYEAGPEGDVYLVNSMDNAEFDKTWPLSRVTSGIPSKFKVVKENDGTWTIQFNRYRDEDQMRAEYDYIDVPSDLTASPDTTPEVPREYRSIISDWVAALVLQDKNDNKATSFFNLAQNNWRSMVKEYDARAFGMTTRFGKITPRRDQTGSITRRLRDLRNITYST